VDICFVPTLLNGQTSSKSVGRRGKSIVGLSVTLWHWLTLQSRLRADFSQGIQNCRVWLCGFI